MEEMVSIPKWQLEKIENTMRLVSNTLGSFSQSTCLDRDVIKHWGWISTALRPDEHK